ncbi:hypothetical protein BD779DRAFT_1611297 [Infundibulicybe gibba]|nr:hypothetical protein BD779DRAFT_1611297 [Infundibulicybe gibba]
MPDNLTNDIFSPLTLPCGVAMYEHFATLFGGPPNQYHFNLYSQWAKYGWGMVITGNVQVSPRHLTLGRDIVLPAHISEETLEPFKQLASSIHGRPEGYDDRDLATRSVAIMQLSHAGRQSPNILGGRFPFRPPLAPSTIRVGSKQGGYITAMLHWLLFQTPQPMSLSDIDELIDSFTRGARVASQSGFDGVQLHAAHGCERVDEYSSNPAHALRLLRRIVQSIRGATPRDFILGIKINAADYTDFDIDGEIAIEHIRSIASWGGVDFIEISGGDYEKPARQALFSRFSHQAVATLELLQHSNASPPPAILLTGGLRTPNLLRTALSANHAHLLGIGRYIPFGPEPDLRVSSFWKWLPEIPLIGAGVGMAWYVLMMRRLSRGTGQSNATRRANSDHPTQGYDMDATAVVLRMFLWFGSDSMLPPWPSYMVITIVILLTVVYFYVNL